MVARRCAGILTKHSRAGSGRSCVLTWRQQHKVVGAVGFQARAGGRRRELGAEAHKLRVDGGLRAHGDVRAVQQPLLGLMRLHLGHHHLRLACVSAGNKWCSGQ